MKIRNGFVTNSSSSSFVCEVCGAIKSGYEMSLEEAGMLECDHGHIFCKNEMRIPAREELVIFFEIIAKDEPEYLGSDYQLFIDPEKMDMVEIPEYLASVMGVDDIKEYASKITDWFRLPEYFCPICSFERYMDYDLRRFLKKEYKVSESEVKKHMKHYFPERKDISDLEYITYVCLKHDLDPLEITAKWKDRFKTYKNFMKYIIE